MRTTLALDSALLAEAVHARGQPTPEAAVEAALRLVVGEERERRDALDALWGVGWGDGEVEDMRGGTVTVRGDGPAR